MGGYHTFASQISKAKLVKKQSIWIILLSVDNLALVADKEFVVAELFAGVN